MTILEMLDRLAEKAPDVCKKKSYSDGPTFVIGSYSFWYDSLDNFQAYTSVVATGRPALAWLADAIMAECEKRGWYFETMSWGSTRSMVMIIVGVMCYRGDSDTLVMSLLATFLAAIEGER